MSEIVIFVPADDPVKGLIKLSKLNLRNARKRSRFHSSEELIDDDTPSFWRQKVDWLIRQTKIIYLAIGIIIGLGVDALGIPKSIVEFKSNMTEAREYASSLVYRTEIWTGIFDTFPEGVVDMNDLGISSSVNAALELAVVEGNRLDGRVWWENSCDLGSPFRGLLLEGYIRIGGSSADVKILDFMDGSRVDFFSGRLENDELTVGFSEFPKQTGLNGSRIARNPDPAKLEGWEEPYCD